MSPLDVNRHTLYETDYLQWIETTLARLRSHDYEQVDWEHLIEEIEDMGRSGRLRLKLACRWKSFPISAPIGCQTDLRIGFCLSKPA